MRKKIATSIFEIANLNLFYNVYADFKEKVN